jgi:hypothetical protein
MPSQENDKRITVHNVNIPGQASQVDAGMYAAMHQAMRRVLPVQAPGLTQEEIRQSILPHLPADLYPAGAKSGWWAKTVQLDMEAKGELVRETTKPLRWHLAGG